ITGIEALIRWNHPLRGVIGPGEFLATSEVAGLAPAIGCKVFEYAMVAIQGWVDEGLEFGRLAVNLSPGHLMKGSIIDDFFGIMEKYNIEPRLLTVEFLESLVIDDPNANIMETLHRFRLRDVHVELDDFGTGYASLSHLSTMPINGLKIDKTFVDQMTKDTRQQGIVTSLISMAKLMKLRVVCEGIETRQQVDVIAQIGKCSIQGYFITKPMSYQKTTDWLKSKRNIGALRAHPEMVRTR
ncbi:MAG: EAL domain-containing protein, partial [Rhizobiales bacterium]|nr:EAL domain-containing protein [Hyphomicrobiales bacterium]